MMALIRFVGFVVALFAGAAHAQVSTLDVLDKDGAPRVIRTIPALGPQTGAGSRSVVFATDATLPGFAEVPIFNLGTIGAAATEATIAAVSGKLPATLGAKTGAASLSVVPASDATFAVSAVSLPLPAGAAAAASQFPGVAQGAETSGLLQRLIAGAVTTAAPTYTTGQSSPLSLRTDGLLRVAVEAGGGTGGTSSSFGAGTPATGTAMGLSDGTNMQPGWAVDGDTGTGGVQKAVQGVTLVTPASGGPVATGVAGAPLIARTWVAWEAGVKSNHTNAYAAHQAIGPSATAPGASVFRTFQVTSSNPAGTSGILNSIMIAYTGSAASGEVPHLNPFVVYVWNSPPTLATCNQTNDFNQSNGDNTKLIGRFFVTPTTVNSVADDVAAEGTIEFRRTFGLAAGVTSLTACIVTTAAEDFAQVDILEVKLGGVVQQ